MIRTDIVSLILGTIGKPASNEDYLKVLTATREELMAAFPNQSEAWYEITLEDSAERLARATAASSGTTQWLTI
jgi:hypothetical protein